MRRILATLAPFVVAGALLASCGADATTESLSVPELYRQQCASCHGSAGQGGVGKTLIGSVDRLGAEGTSGVIANGRLTMPAFGSRITAPQLAGLVSLLATFKG